MKKSLIVGLDLSFNSTGICITYLEDYIGKKIQFHKVVFDHSNNKTGKPYTPEPIKNVNIVVYKMPTNLLVSDLTLDFLDVNNAEQCELTLKAIISSKKIGIIIEKALNKYQPDEVTFAIENYVMPTYSGQTQLKDVGALITLQGFVRKEAILLCLNRKISLKLHTPVPSSNKLFFTGNGNAEKDEMMEKFLSIYDGIKLLPTASMDKVHQLNDVVDAFSLNLNAYSVILQKQKLYDGYTFDT
jgi:hypothetical protein